MNNIITNKNYQNVLFVLNDLSKSYLKSLPENFTGVVSNLYIYYPISPECFVEDDATITFFRNGKRHCETGPAVYNRRIKQWWLDGELTFSTVTYSFQDLKDYNGIVLEEKPHETYQLLRRVKYLVADKVMDLILWKDMIL